jgi:hypothetical protein
MKKQLYISFLVIITIVTLLNPMLTVSAQTQVPTMTPAPIFTPTLGSDSISTPTSVVAQLANPNVVTFTQLQQNEIQLTGPYDSWAFSFATPADWALKEGAQLDLSIGVSFNAYITDVQNQINTSVVVGGGTLTILYNEVILTALPLNKVGEVETILNIPLGALNSNREDGRAVLRFILESSESCRITGTHTIVNIHPTSFLTLPHEFVRPSTSLINFPRPIVQNSFLPDSALVIVPEQPSPAELQAALTVSASLGYFSGNRMILDMTTINNFANEDTANNHLIFVGRAASLPLEGLELPLPVTNGQFQLSDNGPDDGLVEMIDSPWSSSRVILVVSANTDPGIIKAAQAISTGILRPNRFNNLALIEQVNLTPISTPQAVDQSLADLGYQGSLFQSRGYNNEQFIFNIPVGMTVNTDAYFELVFGHSSLMDYTSSQIVVSLNDQPIGSIRMSDATASQPTNHEKITIPPSAIVSGINRLDVTGYMVPLYDCSPPNVQGLWINIWPQSNFHLPLVGASISPVAPQDMAAYPAPFIYDPTLGNTAFVVEHNDLESWRKALQIAAYLGNQASGPLTALAVFYGDELPIAERPKYNLLVIGRPSMLPIVTELNDNLPAPFSSGSDQASESNFQVTYRIAPDSSLGYIETMLSPWNPNNVVLAILGNTTQGVSWAASALIDSKMRSRLAGNFAVVNDQQIVTTDIRFAALNTTTGITTTALPSIADAPIDIGSIQESPSRPRWILPVIATLVGLIVLILMIVIFRNRHKREKGS